jgi:hypothetical protein
MNLASAATLAFVLGGSLFAMRGPLQGSGGDKQAATPVTLGTAANDRLTKLARAYYLVRDDAPKAKKQLDKLIAEVASSAKAQKVADPLAALDDWRDILQAALVPDKPLVVINSHELKDVSLPCPLDSKADVKDMKPAFDGMMKALVSVPADANKVRYPVIIGLHPAEAETKSLKTIRKGTEIGDIARQWAAATYSKELLAKAIVVVPILDFVKRSDDAVSFTRPSWDSDEGKGYIFNAMDQFVRFALLNYDARRIFLDGAGSGAVAATNFCTLFPSVVTGAIVRGPPPSDEHFEERFENAAGVPFLFVGGEKKEEKVVPYAKAILEKFKGTEGYNLTQKDALDDATLLSWLNDHPKVFAPRKVRFRTDDLFYADCFWIRAQDVDPNLEKEPIVVDAVIDHEKNEITVVTSKKVKKFEIFLNDDVLDLSREVRVLHRKMEEQGDAKECFHGMVKRVIEYALDSTWKDYAVNRGEVYVASRTIEVR